MTIKLTVKNSIIINADREKVWDYTQNYENRSKWDSSITGYEYLAETPNRIVRVKSPGNVEMEMEYKLFDKPNITSLAITRSSSGMIVGGGGSWKYEPDEKGTLWTQTNTMLLKDGFFMSLMKPLVGFMLKYNTDKSMKKAKNILEKDKNN
jgi:hypothetical protein